MRREWRICFLLAALVTGKGVSADDTEYQFDGHVKTRFIGQSFSDSSIFDDLTGSRALDLAADLRLNFAADKGPWEMHASYQFLTFFGDRVEYSRALPPDAALVFDRLPNDSHRLFDLTNVLYDEDKLALVHRLDRLWVGFSGEKTVVRFGRQALSWGNGFFFSPMDIVNPFDPTTVDTEYKTGDDMLYGQYLQDNGHDVQAAAVFRRDIRTGDVESDQGTTAIKYHGFAGEGEYDILVSRHYGDMTIGLGGNSSIGGAVIRADLVISDTDESTVLQLVTNLTYSWVWREKNISGVLEYYFNGFGQKDGDYAPPSLATNPELLKRLARGDVFTLGRNYLAGGLTVEISPLWMLMPNLFLNMDDGSAFLQIVTQHSLGDNTVFLGALNAPIGPDGSEYGGIPIGTNDKFLSTDFGIFAQLAWYF